MITDQEIEGWRDLAAQSGWNACDGCGTWMDHFQLEEIETGEQLCPRCFQFYLDCQEPSI